MGTFTPVIDTHTREQTFLRVTSTLARLRQVYHRLTLSILTILGVFSNILIPLLWRLGLGLILPLHAMPTINHCFSSRFPFSSRMGEIVSQLSGILFLPGAGRMTHWSCVPSLFNARVVKKKRCLKGITCPPGIWPQYGAEEAAGGNNSSFKIESKAMAPGTFENIPDDLTTKTGKK